MFVKIESCRGKAISYLFLHSKPEKIEMFLEDSEKKAQYRQNMVAKPSYHVVV